MAHIAIPAIAALWVGLERTHGTFGFAWLDLGNAGINMSLPLRLAPIVGVYGISFVFVMISVGVASVILRYPRKHLWPLAALFVLYLLPKVPQNTPAPSKFSPFSRTSIRKRFGHPNPATSVEQRLQLISDALPARLVVWPELPAPFYYYDDPVFHDETEVIAKKHGYFLFGTVAYTSNRQPMNSAVLVGPDGNEIGRYDKVNLVPFGEFVPPLFGFVNRISPETGDFAPGRDIKVMSAPPNKLGVFICYESAFPDFVRQFARARSDSILQSLQ